MEVILLLLAGYGLANALANEYAFEWLRDLAENVPVLGKLLTCSVCCAFYSGIALSFFFEPSVPFGTPYWALICGLSSSGFTKAVEMLRLRMD